MLRILYVTDLGYEAAGRRYCDEDIWLSGRLRERGFALALGHPLDAARLMDDFDLVLVRNSGPVLYYRAAHEAFRAEASARGVRVVNPLTGRGDMAGKGYLVELARAGFPVVPTVDRAADLGLLPDADEYVIKPVDGADSLGLSVVAREALPAADLTGMLAQPRIRFRYEVSFYFVDRDFQYALYAPDPARRWDLVPYEPGADDLAFARRFVDWNTIDRGVQRVDACRTQEGRLLLVELEDLNPYLSLDVVAAPVREAFADRLAASLTAAAAAG
ncbi:hypothetical protein [Streptomyces fuscigenes]|uniref:hypothetical protein n=1 Tax=Streptomyces fuscigenes TaxID=1528880 RepID=UPI001F16C1AA|nr:hypothetical protein [Streptomyces fuscigenes]MCF3962125.1 hypothetical protein [Streptomyces fuscigenes]